MIWASRSLLGTLAYNVFNLTETGVKVDKFGYNTTAWKQGVKIISNYYVRDTILGTETNSDLTEQPDLQRLQLG